MVSFISRQFITRPDWGNCRGFLIPITGTCSKRLKSTLLLQEVLRGVFSPDAVPLCVQSPSGVDKGAFQVCIHYPDIYVFIILTYCGASAAVLDNAHVRVELYLGIWPERKWWPRPLRTVWPQKPPLISTGLCKTKKKEIRAKQEKSPASVNPDAGLFHRSMPPSARMPRRAAPGRFG